MKKPLIDCEVRSTNIDGETFFTEQTLVDALAYVYTHEGYSQAHVQWVCSNIDHSGRLFDKVLDSASARL